MLKQVYTEWDFLRQKKNTMCWGMLLFKDITFYILYDDLPWQFLTLQGAGYHSIHNYAEKSPNIINCLFKMLKILRIK